MITWPYLAGFFDGEGTARIPIGTSKSLSPTFTITQSGERGRRVLQELADFFSALGIKSKLCVSTHKYSSHAAIKSRLPNWRLGVYRREHVTLIFSQMLPFLNVKKPEVQDILRYCRLYPSLKNNKLLNLESWNGRRMSPEDKRQNERESRQRHYKANKDKIQAYQREWKRKRRALDRNEAA